VPEAAVACIADREGRRFVLGPSAAIQREHLLRSERGLAKRKDHIRIVDASLDRG
jgi:hypothetical protein